MKAFLLAMTAVPALLIAAPAAAQYRYGVNANADGGINNRIVQLQTRVDAGIRAGTINRYEARALRNELWQLQRLHSQYRLNGISRDEQADLRFRIRDLRSDVRIADNGSWDRYERYAYDDRWDREFGYTGRGGPEFDEDDDGVCMRQGGVGGLIESMFERDDDCLVVGDRARSQLSVVPSSYRYRYRDTGGVYFRSDGRRIYEIDARTNRVIDVHPM